MNLEIPKERRRHKRYQLGCPVTVLTPGRGRKRIIGCGKLNDINDYGARFGLDHPLRVNDLISLEVHFSNLDGELTTIRFRGTVKRVSAGALHEVAVSFLKGGSFIRHKSLAARGVPPAQTGTGGGWVQ